MRIILGLLYPGLVFGLATQAGAVTFPNACVNSLQVGSYDQISVTMTGIAPFAVNGGDSVTLSAISQTMSVPSQAFVAGYNLGILPAGPNSIPATVITTIEGGNSTQLTQNTNTAAGTISTTITDPDGVPGNGNESATNGSLTVSYSNQTWTAAASGVLPFREDTVTPVGAATGSGHKGGIRLTFVMGGFISVRYGCSPGTVTAGVASFTDPAVAFNDTDADALSDVEDNCTLVVNNGQPGTGPAQNDADADGYGNICDADLNQSGTVTILDYTILRNALNGTNAIADLNGSGTVTVNDYTILRNALNKPPGPSGFHP